MPSSGTIDATHAPGRGGELDKRDACRVRTANLSPPGFFLGKVRTGHLRYIRWVDVVVRVLFISPNIIVAVGKSKVTTTKEQRTAQAGCTTTSTERRAHRTAHCLQQPGNFSAFRQMRFTHSAVVSKAQVKKIIMVT